MVPYLDLWNCLFQDFYKFLNAVPLKEKTVIYTVPKIERQQEFWDWTKKVINTCDCVFINNENKRFENDYNNKKLNELIENGGIS